MKNIESKCVTYKVVSKKTGAVLYETFGWWDSTTDVRKALEAEHGTRVVKILIKGEDY